MRPVRDDAAGAAADDEGPGRRRLLTLSCRESNGVSVGRQSIAPTAGAPAGSSPSGSAACAAGAVSADAESRTANAAAMVFRRAPCVVVLKPMVTDLSGWFLAVPHVSLRAAPAAVLTAARTPVRSACTVAPRQGRRVGRMQVRVPEHWVDSWDGRSAYS
ncbi:hypothetical protein GCM10010182_64390 [Actinomadura cremea]|nr:hypothetical protein GCM10010182_64390 [Actinomadura cremea]